MALATPSRVWWKAPNKQERVWLALAIVFLLVVFITMPLSMVVGSQKTPSEYYRMAPEEFHARATAFIDRYQVGTEGDLPIVRPPAGDIYLIAQKWEWRPILVLSAGATYRLHLSSPDFQHGFSIQPINMNFQVVPGYDYVVTITPAAGTYTIICNQFCGLGHHQMSGKIIVEG